MALIPLRLPPGVYRNGTNYQSKGRWFDSDLVRWYGGTIRPFGGWVRVTTEEGYDGGHLEGPGRGILTWRPSGPARYAAIGTPNSLVVWDDDSFYDITPAGFAAGNVDTFYGVGYGFGDYGVGPYGETSGGGATEATTWSLDTWGDNLVACASHDRQIYEWTAGDLNGEAALVPNAPSAVAILVTAERILMALGADGNTRRIMWSDVEDNTEWTPLPDNFAGDFRLQTDGSLVTGRRVRGTNLFWTTTDLHRATFIGQPFVYQFDQVSQNCGLVAPLAVQVIEGGAFWMGQKNFFRYDGGRVTPIDCEVYDYVFGDINFDQAAKFSSGHIAAFGEVLFFYCSAGSTEINRCVSYNYRENHWAIHPSVKRGCWADVGAFRFPLAAGVESPFYLYTQENGWTDDGSPILTGRFCKSGPVEIGDGDQIIEANQMVPDPGNAGVLRIRFAQQFTPLGPVYNRGPYPAVEYTDIRLSTRQVAMLLESLVDSDFRFGVQRLDGRPGGRR